MPLQATSGAASYDAFGGGVAVVPTYIEDVFSTYLITLQASGNQQIPHGLDFSTYGGLTWVKDRTAAYGNTLGTTNIGTSKMLFTEATDAVTSASSFVSFDTNGTTITRAGGYFGNTSDAVVSWNFRKQPKFFDVVTWTGSGANRTISHSLGSVPACIMVKRTDTTGDWQVYHRSLANTEYLVLNSSAAKATGATRWNSTTPTSSVFSLGTDATVNASGGTYVAYIFAHVAGGFGLTGTDNVISCGGFTANGNNTITLGYEPQWVMVRRVSSAGNDWEIYDTMRGMALTSSLVINANTSGAEGVGGTIYPTATGFYISSFGSGDIIYIAIRRGPMKVPTTGTSVYNAIARTGTGAVAQVTGVGFPPDLVHSQERGGNAFSSVFDKLRGTGKHLYTQATTAELTRTTTLTSFNMDGITVGADADNNIINFTSLTYINNFFRRAPSFMDVVCFTGTGSATTFSHNLQAVPELMLVRRRSTGNDWAVYANNDNTDYLVLNSTAATADDNTYWNDTSPTSSVFSVGTNNAVNASASTYVAYLFSTCSGVSKVGSYTGTGTTKQIDCGFTAGARFVLTKRTDSTGDWYFWDSTRGIVAGNDPYLLLNTLAAEVTNTDYIDTYSAGFEISSTAPAAINASGGSFIFLAIA